MGQHAVDLCPGFHRYLMHLMAFMMIERNQRCLGLDVLLRNDVVAMINLLCDVFHIVNGLSTFLKTENLNFTDVSQKVDSAVNCI